MIINRIKILVITLLIASTCVFAGLFPWPMQCRPPIPLGDAYIIATKKIEANKKFKDFYCVGVDLCGGKKQDGQEGAWNFSYSSPRANLVIVTVNFDGKVSIQD